MEEYPREAPGAPGLGLKPPCRGISLYVFLQRKYGKLAMKQKRKDKTREQLLGGFKYLGEKGMTYNKQKKQLFQAYLGLTLVCCVFLESQPKTVCLATVPNYSAGCINVYQYIPVIPNTPHHRSTFCSCISYSFARLQLWTYYETQKMDF